MVHNESMERMVKIDKLLRQFPRGISASEIAVKIGVQRTAVYDDLNSLKLQHKAVNKEGLWFPSEEEAEALGSAERYFQWRASPEGGNNGFYRAMFAKKR